MLRFLQELRDPKPRLKPGITYFRLCVFLVVAVGISVVGLNIATQSGPQQDECVAKGIDSTDLGEGTCKEGDSTLVVVDKHSTLKLETLEAKLIAVRYRRLAADRLVTFDLSIRNLTEDPAAVGKGQFMLNAGRARAEDAKFEEGREPRSFLGRQTDIPAQGTEDGTVTFRVPVAAARAVRKAANLDVANLGSPVPTAEPEAIFTEPEYGVIRTYR